MCEGAEEDSGGRWNVRFAFIQSALLQTQHKKGQMNRKSPSRTHGFCSVKFTFTLLGVCMGVCACVCLASSASYISHSLSLLLVTGDTEITKNTNK